jgi:hypothetical protein
MFRRGFVTGLCAVLRGGPPHGFAASVTLWRAEPGGQTARPAGHQLTGAGRARYALGAGQYTSRYWLPARYAASVFGFTATPLGFGSVLRVLVFRSVRPLIT